MDELFEKASRIKLRFDTPRGYISVEDLWDFPLTSYDGASLDTVARALRKQLKDTDDDTSFVNSTTTVSAADKKLQLAFDIAKRIIEVKLAEREAAQVRSDNSAKKQRILEIIARKEDNELEGKPLEELQNLVGAL